MPDGRGGRHHGGPAVSKHIAKRLPDQYDGYIPQIHSSSDRDQDGIDDQTDILEGALAYIASRPRYKSRYYQTGYPDDGCGVCTDVVAAALKNAGYDLMLLVEEDEEARRRITALKRRTGTLILEGCGI